MHRLLSRNVIVRATNLEKLRYSVRFFRRSNSHRLQLTQQISLNPVQHVFTLPRSSARTPTPIRPIRHLFTLSCSPAPEEALSLKEHRDTMLPPVNWLAAIALYSPSLPRIVMQDTPLKRYHHHDPNLPQKSHRFPVTKSRPSIYTQRHVWNRWLHRTQACRSRHH